MPTVGVMWLYRVTNRSGSESCEREGKYPIWGLWAVEGRTVRTRQHETPILIKPRNRIATKAIPGAIHRVAVAAAANFIFKIP